MPSDPSQIEQVLADLVERVRAGRAAADDFDREAARLLGVNETALHCLALLAEEGELSPGELGTRLGVTTGSVTALIDRLERLGRVTRAPHPVDRRRSVVRMTPGALERYRELMVPFLEEEKGVMRELYTGEQLGLIADFLETTTAVRRRHTDRFRGQSGPESTR